MFYAAASRPGPLRPMVGREGTYAFDEPADVMDRDAVDGSVEQIDLRQLRHHTKNTLQRILSLIATAPGLCDTPQGEKIAQDLQYRIELSAKISDALFGVTDAPGSMVERLRLLAGAVVDMMRDADQVIRTGVLLRGRCPLHLRDAVLRCANELVSNAVKHGMKGRSIGRIALRLITDSTCTTLTVIDNGWGIKGTTPKGEGLVLARAFATRNGGSLTLDGDEGTVATLILPHFRAIVQKFQASNVKCPLQLGA